MGEASNDQSNAPTHIRRYCERALRGLDRYDFDIGGTLLNGEDVKVVDCGDVIGEAKDVAGNHQRSEEVVRKILQSGAMPIILGGDHAIPIPVFRALENHGPITLIQVDAHIDWRDVFHGVSQGLSSVIRRASETIIGCAKAFSELDATMVEVNPLVISKQKQILALDCKMSFDNNAMFRRNKVSELRDKSQEDEKEYMHLIGV